MILESSKDLLYVVIAFCILWLTVFTSWAIYYMAQILRQARDTIRDVRNTMTMLEKVLTIIQRKIESSSSHFAFLVESIKQGLQFMNERKAKKVTKATNRTNKKMEVV